MVPDADGQDAVRPPICPGCIGRGHFLTRSLEAIAAKEIVPLYTANFGAENPALPSALKEVPMHINPSVNTSLGRSVGINVPTYYLSGSLSFTQIRTEDGFLDSCNVVHWGEPGAEKVWLFVSPDYLTSFGRVLSGAVDQMRANGEDVSLWRDGCPLPYHHKNLVVTPEFLRRHKISCQVVCQRRGTLVYVMGSVPHQVLNTGVLLAEAVNVGGPRWNATYHQAIARPADHCQASAIQPIYRNRASTEVMHSTTIPFRECPVKGCPTALPSAALERLHARQHEPGFQLKVLACRLCPAFYIREGQLKRHMVSSHPAAAVAFSSKTCPSCGKSYGSGYNRYVKGCKGVPIPYSWCQSSITAAHYNRHRAACRLRPSAL